MKRNSSQWSIVIVGSWNVAILNPEWLAEKVLDEPEFEIELALQRGMRTRLRFRHGNITIAPNTERITIFCNSPDEETLSKAEAIATRLLQELPVTPISALGINIGFLESDPASRVNEAVVFRDSKNFAEAGLELNSTNLSRAITHDGRSFNLTLEKNQEGMDIRFNYHRDVTNCEEAIQALAGKPVEYLYHALNLLETLYDLVEEEE